MPFDEKHRVQQLLIKAQAKYGDLYDYSQAEYINKTTHVKIGCSINGALYSLPKNFLATAKQRRIPLTIKFGGYSSTRLALCFTLSLRLSKSGHHVLFFISDVSTIHAISLLGKSETHE